MAVGDGWDFAISFPDRWFLRDPDDETRRQSTESAVDAYLARGTEAPVDRSWLVGMLLDAAAADDAAGALIAATMWDVADGVEVLARIRVFPGDRLEPDDLEAELKALEARLAEPAPDDLGERQVEVVELPAGRAVVLRMLAESPPAAGGDTYVLETAQYWLPVPGVPESIVIDGSTPNLPLVDGFLDELHWIASSVVFVLE